MKPDEEETQRVDVPAGARTPTPVQHRFEGPARLVVLSGAEIHRRYTVERSVVLGRSSDATVVLDDSEVSRRHAEVRRSAGGGFVIEDFASRNGTWLNGTPVMGTAQLAFGDRIQLGSRVVLLFTHRDPAEEDELQRQRLEALGRLGAGIAHDFNNMVGAMMAGLDYVRSLPKDRTLADTEVVECVNDMLAAARRAADLTPKLLSFARGEAAEHARADVSQLCLEVVQLLRRTLDRSVRIESDIAPNLAVMGDRAELYQLLMNLCLNARDAMLEGGTLRISAKVATAEELAALPARPGQDSERGRSNHPHLVITVRDSGIGMDNATIERIFDPFFTTKRASHSGHVAGQPGGETGQRRTGFGVGLATVKEVVTAHGGHVTVDSKPGGGSVFRVWLPAVVAAVRRPLVATMRGPVQALKPAPESSLLLLIDDEEVLRRSLGRLLKLGGHEVMEASDGVEGVRAYETAKPRPDLVMLDLDMPNLGGEQAFRKLKDIDPGVRVLFVTGHADDARERRLRGTGAMGFVRKPCRAEALLEEVDRALRGPLPSVTI
jgi:signal transduction histidine kinase/CheY-like chemotaxis protein